MQIKTERMVITPEMAQSWLERNERNRPLSRTYVQQLSQELVTGRWRETHQGIAFDETGRLLDGQHRLAAIVKANTSAELLVTWGLSPTAFDAIDQGRRRTAGQLVALTGLGKDPTRTAAMARAILVCAYDETHPSNAEVVERVREWIPILDEYVRVAKKMGPSVGGAFAYAHLRGWSGVGAAADRLWGLLFETEGDPMRALARRAESFYQLGAGAAAVRAKFDMSLSALLAVHEGRELKTIRQGALDYNKLPGVQPALSS